ncbi:MAG: acetyl ornithine aminotransferase family protein [Thermoprotei archaeon]|nr:MAG: aspartate aminotransferase family protein [Thermofilum sp. ex4484_79]RLF07787.1 MAG: acetyl ornithine aminotransferase family protein [Thermoprotei archaeon]
MVDIRCTKVNYPEIIVEPPGSKARKIIERDEKYIMQSFSRWFPLVVSKAYDFIVEDVDGNKYIDFNSGIAVMNVGHCHPKVIQAIKEQLEKFTHYSITDFLYEEPVKLAENLFRITPGNFTKKVYYGNSGAEANEAAIKVVRGHFKGKRPYIIAFSGCFHGRTYGAMSLTASKPIQRKGFYPLVPGIIHTPYPYCYRCPFRQTFPSCNYWCVDFIEEWIFGKYVSPDEVSAFIFEPIVGEGGYIVPPEDFFPRLKKLADKYGILLIADEIQSGMGRTGKWFATEHWNTVPDITTMAKAIASGLPLGATVGRAEIMDLPPGSHASTFGGNPVSCAAANAVIQVIEEERLLENARRLGEYTLKRLNELKERIDVIGDVRGVGLMIGIELVKDKDNPEPNRELLKKVLMTAFKKGLLVIGAGKSVIRISPPLTITQEAVDKGLEIIEKSILESLNK